MTVKSENNVIRKKEKAKIRIVPYFLVAIVFVALVASADAYSISLSKTTDKDTYSVGETITYTLQVANIDTVYNCTLNVTDTYPNGTVEILNSSLLLEPETNETYIRSYVVQAADVGLDKKVRNVLKIEGDNANNEEIRATAPRNSSVLSPLIAIIKTASLDGSCPSSDHLTAHIGDTVTYCFTVINNGDVNMTNIEVTDDTYGVITLTKTSLVPNELTTGTLVHVVNDSDIPSITNNATVTASTEDGVEVTDYDTYTVSVTALDGIRVEKTASPTEGVNGTEINFTITVYNLQDDVLSPVYINDSLPQELVFVSATDGGKNNSQWVNWTINSLAASSAKTVYLVARINVTDSSLGTLTNHVNVTGNSTSGIITNETTATVRAYTTAPNIVSMVQSSDHPLEGENVTITTHVTDDLGVASVNLTYTNRSNYEMTVSMSFISGTIFDGYWNATIPGQPAFETLTIYVTACDVTGNCTSTLPHLKHWSKDLSGICPWGNKSRIYPALPRYTPGPNNGERTPAPRWYPHFTSTLCRWW